MTTLASAPRPQQAGRRMPLWLRRAFLLAAPIVALGMIALGFWQLDRLHQRQQQNAAIVARTALAPLDLAQTPVDQLRADEYRLGEARGVFWLEGELTWRNQALNGRPGMRVITPLRLAGSNRVVLVDRGWLPLNAEGGVDRRAYPPPTGEVAVRGLIRVPVTRSSDLLPADVVPAGGRLEAWFWLDPAMLSTQLGTPVLPVILVAEAGAPTGLPTAGYTLDLSEGSHLNYAIQWFAFATIAIVGPVLYWWGERNRRPGNGAQR